MADVFKVGEYVWAKMKGFPPWPGRISEPPKDKKGTPKKNMHWVFFFGSKNFGWIENHNIKAYVDHKELLSKSSKTTTFREACEEIERHICGGDDILPNDSVNPQDEAFDKLITGAPGSGKSTKLKAKRSDSSNTPDSERKTKSSSEPKSSTKGEKGRKRSISPSSASETPKRRKKLSQDDETVTPSVTNHTNEGPTLNVYNKSRFSEKDFKSDSVTLDLETISQTLKDKNITPSSYKFGFIGLGIVGSGIVKNLLTSGHKVKVWNRSSDKITQFSDAGALVGTSPADVVTSCDIILSCLSDPAASRGVVFGPNGVVETMNSSKSYIELTSIDSETSLDIADAICSKGGRYLEAQLQGSKAEAEEGTLVILCAGDRSLYDDCQSCFESFGKSSFYLGEVGYASKMNLVIQLISGITLGALAEGMALADRVGLQQSDVLEIIGLTSLKSSLILHKAKSIIDSDFRTHMALKHLQKDLKLSLTMADFVEQPLPLTAAANEVYKHAKKLGYAKHDACAVYVRARF